MEVNRVRPEGQVAELDLGDHRAVRVGAIDGSWYIADTIGSSRIERNHDVLGGKVKDKI